MTDASVQKLPKKPQFALGGKPKKPRDVIIPIVNNRWRIFVIGSLIFLFLLPIGVMLRNPYYEAEGWMRVEPIGQRVISKVEEGVSVIGFYRRYIRTQIKRLETIEMIERALAAMPENYRGYFVGPDGDVEQAAKHIQEELEVDEVRDSLLISVTMRGLRPQGLAPFVNSLMETFVHVNEEIDDARDARRIDYLVEEKRQIDSEIKDLRAELSELARETGTATFSSAYDPYAPKLRELEVEFARALGERAEAEGFYRTRQEQQELFEEMPLIALIEERVEADEGLWRIDFYTYQQLQDIRSQIRSMAPTNPERQYLIEQMEGLTEYLGQLRQDVRDKSTYIVNEKRDFELRRDLMEARIEFEAAAQAERELLQERNETVLQLRKNAGLIIKGQFLSEDLDNHIRMQQELADRIQVLEAEAKAPGLIHVEALAREPDEVAGSLLRRYVAAFIILAYGGVAGWYAVTSVLDTRIREEKDVIDALGFPPTWPIPQYIPGAYSEVPFHKVTVEESEEPVSKAIRSLAFRLYHEWKKYGSQVILFSGVHRRAGTTELLLNAAYPLKQIGENILIIDLNGLNYKLADLLEVPTDKPTIGDIIKKGVAPEETVWHDELRGIDAIVSTGFELGGADLGALLNLVRWARERYSLVILDTPPILASELGELLVDVSDVSVLVIQGDRTHYDQLRRSAEQFGRLGAPVFAVALNWGRVVSRRAWALGEAYLKSSDAYSRQQL